MCGAGSIAKSIKKNDYYKNQVYLECYWSKFWYLTLYYIYGTVKMYICIYKSSKHHLNLKMSY